MGAEIVVGLVSVVTPKLDEKPWGGRHLEAFGLDLPASVTIGEALVTAGEAIVISGVGAGRTLSDVVQEDPSGRLGERGTAAVGGKPVFPLLVKLIDASENLSIQAHPDDVEAKEFDRLGKTEAWHVLRAMPRASLYLGLRAGVSMNAFVDAAKKRDGSAAALMRSIPAQVGTTVLIPAGTVHALGAGIVVYEVQQPSDLTFRLDDWGRVDAQGRPREMHVDQGLRVMKAEFRPELIGPVRLRVALGERHLVAACRYFSLERIALPSGAPVSVGQCDSPGVITLLSGEATVGAEHLEMGQSAIIWPARNPGVDMVATAPLVALLSAVPDLPRDVVATCRNAGVSDRAIADLDGPLNDVGEAL